MNHKRPPIPVIVILVLVLLTTGYFGIRALLANGDNPLAASGTIETVSVSLAPEIGGRVVEVYVSEGEAVQTGAPLFRLDDTLLLAQRDLAAASLETTAAAAATAAAAVESARAQYDLAVAAARAEAAANRSANLSALNPTGAVLPGWYLADDERIAAARSTVESALVVRDAYRGSLEHLLTDPANADFVAAEERLVTAQGAFLTARSTLTLATLSYGDVVLRDAAQEAYDAARDELDEAQTAYDQLADTESGQAILTARAELAVAEERYQSAQDFTLGLQTGLYSPRVAAAQAVLRQAEAAAQQALLAVTQAEANLALVDVQIARLIVTAPVDGVILIRTIEPGEFVTPGGVAMTLGRLDDLTITVFVPEDRYGELSLGQSASVTVDSFPGRTFAATVVHIAGQAEFTPRNVQTAEGRTSTVYAIRLQVDDPDGVLKPGMPADVVFNGE
ncbi:MAG: efflux RND transporter periplasmic adaptor subunit [Anaerolineales bacterium]|nr:efflux RND transporter periplasmic adaptor subunit [Anaerolineales bacterium]